MYLICLISDKYIASRILQRKSRLKENHIFESMKNILVIVDLPDQLGPAKHTSVVQEVNKTHFINGHT